MTQKGLILPLREGEVVSAKRSQPCVILGLVPRIQTRAGWRWGAISEGLWIWILGTGPRMTQKGLILPLREGEVVSAKRSQPCVILGLVPRIQTRAGWRWGAIGEGLWIWILGTGPRMAQQGLILLPRGEKERDQFAAT